MANEIVFGAEDSQLDIAVDEAVPALPGRRVLERKDVVTKNARLGEVAHWHKLEDEFEIWEEPCPFVEHFVGVPSGLDINGVIYKGKVIVAGCTAGTLGWMESMWEQAEKDLYRGNTFQKTVASY